jgi:hypothetical protein
MTFKEVEKITKSITCTKMRARAEKINRKYFKFVVYSYNEDKDHEFSDRGSIFQITDERVVAMADLATIDKFCVIHVIRNMMLSIYLHEFDEFFKFDKQTVHSPHFELDSKELLGDL